MIGRKVYIIVTDIFHMLFGVLTILSVKYNTILSLIFPYNTSIVIPFLLVSVYMAYQAVDDDPPEEKVADMIEYAVGLVLGLSL